MRKIMQALFWLGALLVLVAGCSEGVDLASLPPTAVPASSPTVAEQEAFGAQRKNMVRDQIEQRGVEDEVVLAAMRRVERHRFVPEHLVAQAYADHPLPIGHGQTISQPYIVALMTEALALEPGERVLEIGTGSGYQAAVLAEFDVETYTIEIIPELAQEAEARLEALGYDGIQLRNADGYFGWEEAAPFDAIIVTAAPDHMPQPLATQLAEGGRMVIPIGPTGSYQTLWLFHKVDGELEAENLGAVRFVPFTRQP